LSPRPRSCLGTPLIADGKLAGVLTIYSAYVDFFSEEHERIFEAVARQVAPAVRRAAERRAHVPDTQTSRNEVAYTSAVEALSPGTTLMLFEIESAEQGVDRLPAVAETLAGNIRPTDLVFRRGSRQIAVLCNQIEASAATRLMGRIAGSVSGIRTVMVASPHDGTSVEQLLGSADSRLRERNPNGESGRHSIH
jgi:hypothetical protein